MNTKTENAVEVEFPDLPGCVTFGDTYDEAYMNAVDVLAGWLVNAEPQFIRKPSAYKELENTANQIVPVPLDERTMKSYRSLKNVKKQAKSRKNRHLPDSPLHF